MPEFVSSSPPDLESITEAITNAVPDITEITNAVPSVAEIATAVPDITEITNALPDLAAIVAALPDLAAIVAALPDVTDITNAFSNAERWTSSPILCVPDAGVSPIIVASGNAAYGAWVQLLASIGASDAVLVGVGCHGPDGADPDNVNIRIGIGGAGSEASIAAFRLGDFYRDTNNVYCTLPVPILIPSGSRVSASAAAASIYNFDVSIQYIVLPL